MILLIDNYDSFTYNLYQYLSELGETVEVLRNDAITTEEVAAMAPDSIVISPGPCTPTEAGISCETIERFAGEIPILGVCLGHQSVGQVFGGDIVRAPRLMHGKTSEIRHDGRGVYQDLPNPLTATRYHSLIVRPETLDADFEQTAWSVDRDELMGIRSKTHPTEGVQFHPESFLTDTGHALLKNFLSL